MKSVSVIGGVQADLVVWYGDKLPEPGTELLVDDMRLRPGGAAANAALALAGLGLTPRLVGSVGSDLYGQFVSDHLLAAGIENGVVSDEHAATGLTIALEVPGQDRSFLTSLGSLETFSASMVPDDVLTSELVLLCDYFNLPSLRGEPSKQLLQSARRSGATTFFDCAWDSDGWPEKSKREILNLLPFVDVFLPNEIEASSLTDLTEPKAAARELQEASGGWIVVKLGSEGALAVGPGGAEHLATALKVQVKDTTGAGDSFNAGLLYAMAAGEEMPDALELAARVASTVVSRDSSDRYPKSGEVLPPVSAT